MSNARSVRFALPVLLLVYAAWAAPAWSRGADAQGKWTVQMPRQGWASADGVVDLKPLQAIPAASVADRLMIADVFAHWGMAYDEGRLDVIRSLFTPDGVLEGLSGSDPPHSPPMMRIVGRDAIAHAVAQERSEQADQRRHAMSNVVIEKLQGNIATAYAYAIVSVAGHGELYLGASVIYRAQLQKGADGVWRLRQLVIGLDSYRTLERAGSSRK